MADYIIVLSVIISNINAAAVYFILAVISGILLFLSCLLGQWLSSKLSPVYPSFPPTMPSHQGSQSATPHPTLRKQWTKDFLGQTYTQCKGVDCCSTTKLSKDLFHQREDSCCLKDSQCCDRPDICGKNTFLPEMCGKDNDMAESLSGIEEDYQYSVCPGQLHHNADTLEVTQPQWKFYRLTDGRKETLV